MDRQLGSFLVGIVLVIGLTSIAQGKQVGSDLYRPGGVLHCHDCNCDCYTWKTTAGALFWTRTSPGGGTVLTDTNHSPLMDANDYNFSWYNGWKIGLEKRLNSIWAVETRFFRVDSFDSSNSFTSTADGAMVPYSTAVGVIGETLVDTTYSSELSNLAVNLRRNVTEKIDLVFGFRYMQLNDRYLVSMDTTGTDALHNIHTFNNMYGFHMGTDVCLLRRGPFFVEWGTRLGVYGSRIENGVDITVNGTPAFQCRGGKSHTAFSADMALAGTYQYNDHLAIRFGYQVLWLEGVAEATAQIPLTEPLNETIGVDTDGSPFFHGAFIDLALSW